MRPAAAELYAELLASLFDRRWRRIGAADVTSRHSLGGRFRAKQERREPALELVFLFELFDLDEADVAPGSDEVGNDNDGGFCGLFNLGHCAQYKLPQRGGSYFFVRIGSVGSASLLETRGSGGIYYDLMTFP